MNRSFAGWSRQLRAEPGPRGAALYTLLAVAVLSCGSCGSRSSASAKKKATATLEVARVATYRVTRRSFQRQVEFPATLIAAQEITLVSKVPGEIQKITVAVGDKVKRGQTLIQLDRRDFALALRQAQAQRAAAAAGVETARAGLDTVDTSHARVAALRKEKAVSQSNFDDVEGRRKVTAAQLKGAQAQLQLGQVAVDAAATNLSYTTIRAPFDGTVGKRMVDEGARVMPQAPLLTLIDDSSVKVEGGVAEGSLPYVKKGAAASITIEALGATPIKAAVDRLEPVVDPRTRTASVRVVLPNADGRLQTGMSARVVLDLGQGEAPAVPDDAVIKGELGASRGEVMVVSGGKAHRREVILGQRSGDVLEVRKGLEAGEQIVRGGQEKLQEGQPVQVEGDRP
jgi:RND family efflux transporter MFP subunit